MAVRECICALRSDQRGATAIEYGLIAALIAISIMTGLSSMGAGSDGMWTKINADVLEATT